MILCIQIYRDQPKIINLASISSLNLLADLQLK